MNKAELIRKIESMIHDRNYWLNSKQGTSEQNIAWEYSREVLQIVLKMVNNLEV